MEKGIKFAHKYCHDIIANSINSLANPYHELFKAILKVTEIPFKRERIFMAQGIFPKLMNVSARIYLFNKLNRPFPSSFSKSKSPNRKRQTFFTEPVKNREENKSRLMTS